jgi:hypothetical protein
MKKLALILISLALMSCAMLTPPAAEPAPASPTLDPGATPAVEMLATATPDAQEAAAPLETWTVELLQDGQVIAPQGERYLLKKAPFTLRVTFPGAKTTDLPFGIFLNAQETDANYQRVKAGSVLVYDPGLVESDPRNFIFGGGAEPSQPGGSGSLFVDQADGWISNYLYHYGEDDTRWHRASFPEGSVIFERDMTSITLVNGPDNLREVKLADYTGEQLYLVFLLDYNDPLVTGAGLKKAVIVFE